MELHLNARYFNAVMISYDFAMLCTISQSVFVESRGKDVGEELKSLLKKCHALNEDRKRVAHGLWVAHMEGGIVHHVSRGLKISWDGDQAQLLESAPMMLSDLRVELESKFFENLS